MQNTPAYTKLTSKIISRLESAIENLQENINELQRDLDYQKSLLENNIYEGDLESVLEDIEEKLAEKAAEDCVGAYNCGLDKYTQQFVCNGIPYKATMSFGYNRHDKTYYYVEDCHFSYKQLE